MWKHGSGGKKNYCLGKKYDFMILARKHNSDFDWKCDYQSAKLFLFIKFISRNYKCIYNYEF